MTVMTEPYYKTKITGLCAISITVYMMPFKPTIGVTDKTSFGVLLEYAIHFRTSKCTLCGSFLCLGNNYKHKKVETP